MMMPVQMTFRHVALEDETFFLIRDLSDRLGRTWRDVTRCHVTVDRVRNRQGPYRVRVLMSVPGRRLIADREVRGRGGLGMLHDAVLGAFDKAQRLLADDHSRRVTGRNGPGGDEARRWGPPAERAERPPIAERPSCVRP